MQTKKITVLGLCVALAMILSYIESILPVFVGIPGAKLGLPNMVIVLLLYLMGEKEAICVNVLRILLSGFLFGNLFSILYSLAGAAVSFFVMWLTKKRHLSIRPVSVLGGISHNIGQFLVALVLLGTAMWYYLPYLLFMGMVTGLCNGILGQLMYDRRAAFIHSDRK